MNTPKSNIGDQITVRVLKHDGAEYRRWNARRARQEGSLLILDAEFEFDVQHESLGKISKGTQTAEYYWLDRWYNVFRFLDEEGGTTVYYCNINTPPKLEGDVLSYVDLDIDVLVQSDFSFEVLDLEEFEVNAIRYGYSDELKSKARAALDELLSMLERREFPFTESALPLSVTSVLN
jgi:protein associated with RNAse G/E